MDGYGAPGVGEDYFDGDGTHDGTTTGHTAQAAIEHLGYHLAWYIYDEYSSKNESVDVVAHSMGGLIIRYAVGEAADGNPAFPPSLIVGNVVSLGTPHGGANLAKIAKCAAPMPLECSEISPGSTFLLSLEHDAWNPQGAGVTLTVQPRRMAVGVGCRTRTGARAAISVGSMIESAGRYR